MKVGIIGVGEAGATLHLPALSQIPSATVVGICDRDRQRLDAVASRWRVAAFADPAELLGRVRPDVVIIGTPPETHARLCLDALAAGAHVVCEKPFVCSLDEADAVVGAAMRAGRQVAVNHEFAEMPIFKSAIEGALASGPVRVAQAWQLLDMPPWNERGWRGELGERTLFEAGVHLLDLLLAAFGEIPVSVQAAVSAGGHEQRVDAVVSATLQFSGGRIAQLVQNRLCKGERQYLELRLDTDAASFRASFGGRARLSAGLVRSKKPHVRLEYGGSGVAWREEGSTRRLLARNPADPNVAATRELLIAAFEACRENRAPRSSGAHARDLLAVTAACYLSAQTGARIDLGPGAASLRHLRIGAGLHATV